jgi:hypothetical protein
VLVVAGVVLSLGASLVAQPAGAAVAPVVPLTDGIGHDPWSFDIVGVTSSDVVVTETNPTNLTLGTRNGPVLAIPRAGGPARVLNVPAGQIAVAGDTVLSLDQRYDHPNEYAWLDLSSSATGTGMIRYGDAGPETYTEAGAFRLIVPVYPGPVHLVRRNVQTDVDTDLGEVPDVPIYTTGVISGGGHTVVLSTTAGKAELLNPAGGFTSLDLPAGLGACPSVTTDALGCWSGDAVSRVPLDGSAPVVVTGSSPSTWVAVTPARTAWYDYAGTGLALRAAAGGPVAHTSLDVQPVTMRSAGTDVYVVLTGALGDAGLGVLHDGDAEATMLKAATASPLAASSLVQSTGRVLWTESFDTQYRWRSARVVDGTLRLGTPGRIASTGSLGAVSGDTQLSGVTVSGGTAARPRVDLYVGRPGGDSFLRSAVAGTAALSGDRVMFGWSPPTGPVRLAVEDIASGATTLLPDLGTDPDYPRYVFWGDAIAYVKPDNSVWWRNLSTGQTIAVTPPYATVGPIQLWGDVVAWQTAGGSSDPDQWTWADVHHLDAPASGRLVRLTNDGALVSTALNSNEVGPVELHPYEGSAPVPVADNAVLSSAGADGAVGVWIDADDLQPRGRVLDLAGGRPRALSPVTAPIIPDSNANFTVRVPTSTRLTTCQVVLRDATNAVVHTSACDPTEMELGVATATVPQLFPMGYPTGYPAGVYGWTLEAGNADGALLGLDGSPTTYSGTVYSPQGVQVTKYLTPTTVLAGKPFTLTTAASGIPAPKVQWFRATVPFTRGTAIPGATKLSYTTIATPAMNGNVVRAEFDNGWLADATGSVITVLFPPRVTTAPRSVTARAGTVASFTAGASANPGATVRWQYSADRGRHWTSSTATSTTLRIKAPAARNGWRLRAVFHNAYGTAVTTAAVLRVS